MAGISQVWTWVTGRRTYNAAANGETACRPAVRVAVPPEIFMRDAERRRENLWQMRGAAIEESLHRRALLASRCLRLVQNGSILELGAGSGLWTSHLAALSGGDHSITAAIFNEDLRRTASVRKLLNVRLTHVADLENQFPPESFDSVIIPELLSSGSCGATLNAAYRWLKPGGQVIVFAQNTSQIFHRLKSVFERHRGNPVFAGGPGWMDQLSAQGFTDLELVGWELPGLFSKSGASALLLEHAPAIRRLAHSVSFRAVKPASLEQTAPPANIATHRQLLGEVSVVVPCHNEQANIRRLIETLLGMYCEYIREILIVDDNSTDRTAEIAQQIARSEPRVRVICRRPPCGVGRALRQGYAAATGRYILSIDSDFACIAAELRSMFDALAEGYDGAIGSRFSGNSVLIRYPFFKIVCNRGFHFLLNLLLGTKVRDVSNNLKLYRADILKNLAIEENHFAANLETGLKPVLAGYSIREISASWINRTASMGESSFKTLEVGPGYVRALSRIAWKAWKARMQNRKPVWQLHA